ncbi:MAG: TlpA disulfide reductase family protein [Corynebacterium sp.]|nr:TlpA disulfide reductase family protein [Corynebacterium sp.]
MNKAVKISIASIIVLTAIVIAAATTMLKSDSPVQVAEETSSVANVAARPDCPEGIDLPCLGGEIVPAEQKPMVINVWAWWCEPCREELPLIQRLAEQRSDLTVVGVHEDSKAANGAAFLNDMGVDLPSYQDSTGVFAAKYELPSVVPVTVVLRADGSVAARLTQSFDTYEELNAAVNSALQ